MDSHVGSNGPGATGISSFISGNDFKSPIGTLSCACGGVTVGIGASLGRVAQPVIAAISATAAVNCIPYLAMFIFFLVNFDFIGQRIICSPVPPLSNSSILSVFSIGAFSLELIFSLFLGGWHLGQRDGAGRLVELDFDDGIRG